MFGCLSFPLEQYKKKKKKFVSYYSLTVYKFLLITMNKKHEKMANSQDDYNKVADQTVPPHNMMPVFYPARHVLLILTREFLITKHLINCL